MKNSKPRIVEVQVTYFIINKKYRIDSVINGNFLLPKQSRIFNSFSKLISAIGIANPQCKIEAIVKIH